MIKSTLSITAIAALALTLSAATTPASARAVAACVTCTAGTVTSGTNGEELDPPPAGEEYFTCPYSCSNGSGGFGVIPAPYLLVADATCAQEVASIATQINNENLDCPASVQ